MRCLQTQLLINNLILSEMCGIAAIVHSTVVPTGCHCITELSENQVSLLQKRGPDSSGSFSFDIFRGNTKISFVSTVLHHRGSNLTLQPLKNSFGDILLWNGEIFDGINISEDKNDGEELLHLLSIAKTPENILSTISEIQGPWAFIYWQNSCKCLWFGRDILGRRSLLWNKQKNNSCSMLKICSVADDCTWDEVSADGIFCFKFSESRDSEFTLYPWSHLPSGKLLRKTGQIADIGYSSVITTVFCEPLNDTLPTNENISVLYNIKPFENGVTQPAAFLPQLECSVILQQTAKTFINKMEAAVRKRINNQKHLCQDCLRMKLKCGSFENCSHSSVAILYSGGVDSIFLAALADRCIPKEKPIDLLNVSFQHKIRPHGKKNKRDEKNVVLTFDSPDRQSGKDGLKELKLIAPTRQWNFIEINVTPEELQKERNSHIHRLIAPCKTVLDDSIGCAVWFAANGKGTLRNDTDSGVPYFSPARVVLVGMGADEQLAGYSRHRAIYSKTGWTGLIEEIGMEIDRISSRNLGRDDRIISDHGREARFPFLDEDIVSYLKQLPIWFKANLSLPRGIGEKMLLRLAAALLGLTHSSILPKRAVQFGSRIAHLECRKEKGSDICSRLVTCEL